MKYTIFFSLLFILTTSKKENKFTSFLSLANQMFLEEDTYTQCAAETEKVCLNIQNRDDLQCCYLTTEIEEESINTCTDMINPFRPIAKVLESSKINSFIKEIFGFAHYGPPQQEFDGFPENGKLDIKCKDGQGSLTIGKNQYTQRDKEILNSTNYCLYDIYDIIEKKDFNPKTINCGSKKLLDSSTKDGLECAYLDIHLEVENETLDVNSCILFDLDLYSRIEIPEQYLAFIKEFTQDNSFSLVIQDSTGNKVFFDSKSGKFVVNKSSFISVSKYLLILIGLFLF